MNRNHQQQQSVSLFENILQKVADVLPERPKTYLLPIFWGVLLAVARRRTVAKWIRAALLSEQFRRVFYHIPYLARKSDALFDALLDIIFDRLAADLDSDTTIQIILDDSPTKRYGSHVEGAGTHHNPTPGKTDAKFCYGHSWVVAALVLTHPLWGKITLPIRASLYLRQKEIDKLVTKYNRTFQTKLTIAVEIVKRLRLKFKRYEKILEVIVDGGYAKEPVRIKLYFLPPYSPNLNWIERLWKFFKKILYNEYYEKFEDFYSVYYRHSQELFPMPDKVQGRTRSLLAENFHLYNQ